MRVYEVGGVSDAELIKSKIKTRERVEPPLTAADSATSRSGCPPPTPEWRWARMQTQSLPTPAPLRWRRRSMRRSPLAAGLGRVHEILAAIRAGKTAREATRVAGRGRCRSACGTFSVSAFRLSGSRRSTPTAAGAFSARGSHRPS